MLPLMTGSMLSGTEEIPSRGDLLWSPWWNYARMIVNDLCNDNIVNNLCNAIKERSLRDHGIY